MQLFLDSAHLPHVQEIASWGVLDGLTTNPTLVSKEGSLDFKKHVQGLCKMVDGPVSVEVTALDATGMVKQGLDYSKWADNVVVKLPMTVDGLKACHELSSKGIPVNMTLVFSANQALLAAKAGARFVSVFIGRLDDDGQDGLEVLRECLDVVGHFVGETEILAASIRHPRHVTEAAMMGCDAATIPYDVFKKLALHPKTDAGLSAFLTDWNAVHGA